MLARLFPQQFDNDYRGWPAALWLFGLLAFIKLGMAGGVLFSPMTPINGPDGIAIERFSPEGQIAFLWGFTSVGFAMGLFALLSLVALIRYRSMVPLMFFVLLIENIVRVTLSTIYPVVKSGTGISGEINVALIAALALGWVMSLQSH